MAATIVDPIQLVDDIPLNRLGDTSNSLPNNDAESAPTPPSTRSLLPTVDGGRQAWAYLISATILETLVWGEYGVSEQDDRFFRLTWSGRWATGFPLSYGGQSMSDDLYSPVRLIQKALHLQSFSLII
jgi:hypothetical protein